MKFSITVLLICLIFAGCASVPESVRLAQEAFSNVKLGDEAAGKGDIDTAIAHYEKALELTPRAPKWRIMYAQILYLKGLCYDVESHSSLDKTRGWEFDTEIGKFRELQGKLTKEQEQEELHKFKKNKREALAYFNKALNELRRCDIEFNFAEDRVPEAMALIFIMKEDYDNAKVQLKRLLDSSRVKDSYKEDIRKALRKIENHQHEIEKKKPPEDLDKLGQ